MASGVQGKVRSLLMISVRVMQEEPLTHDTREWRQISYQVWNGYGEESGYS